MATIDIRLDGVSITDRVLFARSNFVSVADGNPGTATVVIDNSDRGLSTADIDAGTPLELYVDGSREWDGWVINWSVGWPFQYDDTTVPLDTPVFWTLSGMDRNLLFQRRIMFRTADPDNNRGFKIWPEDTPDKTAIEFSLDKYVDFTGDGLSFDIEQIDSPSPWEEFTLGFVSAPMGVLFEDCSEMTGGVYWIGPDRTLHYKSDITVTAPFTLSDTPTGGQVGYRDLDAGLDYTKAATEALVWGAGKGSAELVFKKYTNDTAESTYGLWQWGDFYAGAWKQQTVNRRARTYVTGSPTHRRGHDEPVPTVRLTVFTPGLRAGMVVLIVSTLFAYSEALPIRKMTMTFPTPSEVQYEIEASLKVDTPFGIPDPWWKKSTDEDTPYREWFDVPGHIPDTGGDETTVSTLVDHYDSSQRAITDLQDVDVATTEILLPDGIQVGDVVVVMIAVVQGEAEAPDYNVGTLLTWTGGWTCEWQAPGSFAPDYTVGFVHKRIDGTEGFTGSGDTLPLSLCTTLFPINADQIWGYAERISNDALPVSVDGQPYGYVHGDEDLYVDDWPYWVDPEWTPSDNVRLYSASFMGHATGTDPTAVTISGEHTSFTTLYNDNEQDFDHTYEYMGAGIALGVRDYVPGANFIWPTPERTASLTDPPWSGADIENLTLLIRKNPTGGFLKTPGQEVTDAPWPGGNVYRSSSSLSSTNDGTDLDEYVEDSIIKGPDGPSYYLDDTHTDFVDDNGNLLYFLQPSSYARTDPWSGFSTGWWSSGETPEGADLLIKWRHVGDWVAGDNLRVELTQHSIPLEGSGSGTDGAVQPIDIWSSYASIDVRGGTDSNLSIYIGNYPFNGDDWPHYGPDATGYEDVSLIYPFHAYYGNDEAPHLEKDTWYLTRVQFGRKPGGAGTYYLGFPYDTTKIDALHSTGWNLTRVKTWKYDEAEPTSGDSDLFWWYWEYGGYTPPEEPPVFLNDTQTWTTGGWDIAIGQAWNSNVDPDSADWADGGWNYSNSSNYYTDYGRNLLRFYAFHDPGYEIDAVWASHSGVEQALDDAFVIEETTSAVPPIGTTDTSQPYYDNTENTENSRYITRYPYRAGTLKIWFEGVRLTRNTDFIETDPRSGVFTLNVSSDQSGRMLVKYERAGSTENTGYSGGEVYRPAPVLQYGWGSALDGYNCTMAVGCMMLDRHTQGQYTPYTGDPRATPPIMRTYQNDQVGGTDLWDLATAWSNGWGQSLQLPSNDHTWSDFVSYVDGGRGAILSGTYSQLPSSKRFSSTWSGGHGIYINERFSNGNFWGCDPLYRYPVVYTEAELQAYALGFVTPSRVTAAFTQVT